MSNPIEGTPGEGTAAGSTSRRWQEGGTAFILATILVMGACTKWRVLPTMETHVDDLLVATTILEARNNATEVSLRQQLTHGRISRVLRWIDRHGYLGAVVPITTFFSVPVKSTYAPGQFFLTTALLRGPAPYRTLLVRGRLPSWIAGTLAACLVALVAFQLGGPGTHSRAIVAAVLVATSWQLVIFSAQMESYAIGVVGVLLFLWLLLSRSSTPTLGQLIREGGVLVSIPWLQYQLVFLTPAYLCARLFQLWRGQRSFTRVARAFAIAGVPALVSIGTIFYFFLSAAAGHGVNWNAGPQGEFLFTVPRSASLGAVLAYILRFFANNAVTTFSAMVSFLPEEHPLYGGAAALLLGFAATGVPALARRTDLRARSALVFVGVTAAIWIVLISARLITLSPTRHSLILLPLIALLVAEGVYAVGAWIRRPASLALVIAALVVTGFLSTYPNETARRQDPFDEPAMRKLVRETRADLIVTHTCTRNLRLMRDLGAPLLDSGCGASARLIGGGSPTPLRRILFVSARSPLSAAAFEEALAPRIRLPELSGLVGDFSRYDATVIRADRGPAPVEVSSRTVNGTNSLYVSLLELRQ